MAMLWGRLLHTGGETQLCNYVLAWGNELGATPPRLPNQSSLAFRDYRPCNIMMDLIRTRSFIKSDGGCVHHWVMGGSFGCRARDVSSMAACLWVPFPMLGPEGIFRQGRLEFNFFFLSISQFSRLRSCITG